jgi:hypothetical protein
MSKIEKFKERIKEESVRPRRGRTNEKINSS